MLIPDKEILHDPPRELLDDIYRSRVIFYIGSSFLQPSRYEHIDKIMRYIKTEKSFGIIGESGSGRGTWANIGRSKYSDLRGYIQDIWSPSSYDPLVLLLRKFRSIREIITTNFDKALRDALRVLDSDIVEITGVESTSYIKEFKINLSDEDLLLYQLLGSIRKPDTLYLSEDEMYELRERFRNPEGGKFIKDLLVNKTLVLLGYESYDVFDIFFRGLIKDISYYSRTSELFPTELYFVGEIEYDTSFGMWGNRDEKQIKIIGLSPDQFIKKILEF